MVRRQEHEHDDDNPNAKGSARAANARLPLLDRNAALQRPDSVERRLYLLAERKIRFYSRHICFVDARYFA